MLLHLLIVVRQSKVVLITIAIHRYVLYADKDTVQKCIPPWQILSFLGILKVILFTDKNR